MSNPNDLCQTCEVHHQTEEEGPAAQQPTRAEPRRPLRVLDRDNLQQIAEDPFPHCEQEGAKVPNLLHALHCGQPPLPPIQEKPQFYYSNGGNTDVKEAVVPSQLGHPGSAPGTGLRKKFGIRRFGICNRQHQHQN